MKYKIYRYNIYLIQLNYHSNLDNSGMVGRRRLPDPSFNHIFNALSIGVQYTLSFQLPNIGLKCLVKGKFVKTSKSRKI